MPERENFFAKSWHHLERSQVEDVLRDALTRSDQRQLQLEEANERHSRIHADLRERLLSDQTKAVAKAAFDEEAREHREEPGPIRAAIAAALDSIGLNDGEADRG